jgi:hypothetical protein
MSDLTKFNGLSALFGMELEAPAFELIDPEEDSGSLLKKIHADIKRNNPDWAFRSTKITSLPTITWYIPDTTDIKEIVGDVIGIRGFLIKPNHDLFFYDGVNKTKICASVGAEPMDAPRIDGNGVLPRPIYGPGVAKRNSNNEIIQGEPDTPDQLLIKWNPQGSRGMSCVECVQRGLHKQIVKDNKGNDQTQSCSGTTNLIFVVFAVALQTTNAKTRVQTATWHTVTDLKDTEGNHIYEKPFVLNIGISTSVATAKGKYEVKTSKTHSDSPVPEDVQPYSIFLNDVIYQPGRSRTAVGGRVIYNPLIEIWGGQMTEACKKNQKSDAVKCVPVFRLADADAWSALTGKEVTDSEAENYHSMPTPLVHAAQKIYQTEYLEAGGQLDKNGTPVLQSQMVRQIAQVEQPSLPQSSNQSTTQVTVDVTPQTDEVTPKTFSVFKRVQ